MLAASDDPDRSTSVELHFFPGRTTLEKIYREAPPAWLADAISTVVRDMAPAIAANFVVGYLRDGELERWGVVSFESPDGRLFGFGIPEDAPVELLVALADGLQENLPELTAFWGQALPRCPTHAHPARAVVAEGVAWWSCPQSNALLTPIGSFARA